MKRLISSMSGNQKGFTLIELLVVVAILGVIAAVVALNISTFFGRGTVQAANTELHQVQTAIIALMADTESDTLDAQVTWSGGTANAPSVGTNRTAAEFVYGPFRAAYTIATDGRILSGNTTGVTNPWSNIAWNADNMNWSATD